MAENILINGAVYTDVESIRLKNTYGKDVSYGITPHIGEDHNWYIGDNDTGIRAEGRDGTSYMSPPIFANNISECTDTSKLYVLPDGYIYGYITVSEITKAYTNLAKNITVGRFNSSGNVDSTTTVARACTDWIPLDKGTVRVKGFGALTDYNTCVYTKINTSPYSGGKANAQLNLFSYSYDSTSGIVSIDQVKSELTYMTGAVVSVVDPFL